jgi:hypothetical protein
MGKFLEQSRLVSRSGVPTTNEVALAMKRNFGGTIERTIRCGAACFADHRAHRAALSIVALDVGRGAAIPAQREVSPSGSAASPKGSFGGFFSRETWFA